MHGCVASLGAEAAARPRLANAPRPCPTFGFLWRCRARRNPPRTRFSPCAGRFGVFIGPTRRPRSCFLTRSQPHSSCRGRHCASGDLTRSFLPSASWCVVLMFVEDALIPPPTHTHTPNQNYTIPSTSVDISQPCQKSLPLKPLEIEPSPSRRARFVGYASSKMTATGGKRKQTPTQRPTTAAYRPDSERFPRQM